MVVIIGNHKAQSVTMWVRGSDKGEDKATERGKPRGLGARTLESTRVEITKRDFPGGAVVKNPPANAGDTGLNPGPGRSHMPRSN